MPTTEAINLGQTLGALLTAAWLLPLAGFAVEIFGGFLWSRKSKTAAQIAVACIGTSFLLSAVALVHWGRTTEWSVLKSHDEAGSHETGSHEAGAHDTGVHASAPHAADAGHEPAGAHHEAGAHAGAGAAHASTA